MANMAFGVLCVRDFLAANGHVLTVRGYDYRTGSATVRDLNDIRISRKKVCEILTENELAGFVPLSGFKTAAAWMKQIKRFCKGRKWLYRVQIIDDDVIDAQERDYEEREHRRAYNLIDDVHPLDIRSEPAMKDPALIDLQPFKDAAHADRLDADERAAERKRERLREIYGEQMQAAPTQEAHDPEKIMKMSNAEPALKTLCGNS